MKPQHNFILFQSGRAEIPNLANKCDRELKEIFNQPQLSYLHIFMAEKRQVVVDSYVNIKDPQNVMNFLERNLKIVRGLIDRAMEAEVYCYLGIAYPNVEIFGKPKSTLNKTSKFLKK